MSYLWDNPNIVAALVVAFFSMISLFFNIRTNLKIQNRDLEIKEYNARIAESNSLISDKLKDLKIIELENIKSIKLAEIRMKRFEIIKSEISELSAILDVNYKFQGPFPPDLIIRVNQLCSSISHWVSPTGKFNEEFNIQIGHIRQFFSEGGNYWSIFKDFRAKFNLNSWMLIDSEYYSIIKTIEKGKSILRKLDKPYETELY